MEKRVERRDSFNGIIEVKICDSVKYEDTDKQKAEDKKTNQALFILPIQDEEVCEKSNKKPTKEDVTTENVPVKEENIVIKIKDKKNDKSIENDGEIATKLHESGQINKPPETQEKTNEAAKKEQSPPVLNPPTTNQPMPIKTSENNAKATPSETKAETPLNEKKQNETNGSTPKAAQSEKKAEKASCSCNLL